MSIWPSNTDKVITIIAKETADIKVYFKPKDSALAYQQITNTLNYKGSDTWEILANFNIGEYIIKTIVVDDNITIPIHTNLIVKDISDIDIAANIRDLNDKITSVTSWNAVS